MKFRDLRWKPSLTSGHEFTQNITDGVAVFFVRRDKHGFTLSASSPYGYTKVTALELAAFIANCDDYKAPTR